MENHESGAVTAKVTEELPAGLNLINASQDRPQLVDLKRWSGILLNMASGAFKTIDYTAKRFVR